MKTIFRFEKAKFKSLKKSRQLMMVQKTIQELEQRAIRKEDYHELLALLVKMQSWMEMDLGVSDLLLPNNDRQNMALLSGAWLNRHSLQARDADILVHDKDGDAPNDESIYQNAQKMIIILEDLRSAFNVGSIFRTSECLGVKELWLCGITCQPQDSALAKTAMGTDSLVSWRAFENAQKAVLAAKKQGRNIYALETVKGAKSVFEAEYESPLALVLGNEALGISQEVLNLCDEYIRLPMQGWKNSLNVAVAFGISGFFIARHLA